MKCSKCGKEASMDELTNECHCNGDSLDAERCPKCHTLLYPWMPVCLCQGIGLEVPAPTCKGRLQVAPPVSTGSPPPETEPLTFRRLQDEQRPWVAHNFAGRHPYYPLLGAMEELGELSHAHLKALQGIRTNEDHEAAKRDAIGDIVIYLADYCSANEIDFQQVVEETWAQVKQRDWRADPVKGGTR